MLAGVLDIRSGRASRCTGRAGSPSIGSASSCESGDTLGTQIARQGSCCGGEIGGGRTSFEVEYNEEVQLR